MYIFRLGDLRLPIPPESVEMKAKNQNKTTTLIDGFEYNFTNKPGLTEISFEVLIPAVQYPFAIYENGFQNQKYYLDQIEKLKVDGKPFLLKIIRDMPNGEPLYDTEMNVTLEEYTIKESAENGFDIVISIKLKEYFYLKTAKNNITENGEIVEENKREESQQAPTPQNDSYTVKKGDTLWTLAKYYYGDGSKYKLIASANPQVTNPNLIYVGQVLVIPKE